MGRILIIEDQPELLSDLLLILELEGYEVEGASTGQEGVQLAFATPPNLILCDFLLPDINGLDIVRQLREDPCTEKTPVIFITAIADPALHQACLSAGAIYVFEKPFAVEKLLETIRSAIQSSA